MNYKEKYEQGIECIQEILSGAGDSIKTSVLRKRLQPFFPELKDDKDERIRKAIIAYINHGQHNGISNKDMIAWLEKQGEQKYLIAEIKNRKALLGAEKEKAVSSTDKLSLGARIAMLDELLAWVKKQDKEDNTYIINNTPNCGISVNIYNDNEECKENKDERMKEQLCDFLRDNMLYQDAQEITSWLEKLIEKQKD